MDLDDEELKATRELHGVDKKVAITDKTYCTNKECIKKCWRHISYYKFKEDTNYCFAEKCIKTK